MGVLILCLVCAGLEWGLWGFIACAFLAWVAAQFGHMAGRDFEKQSLVYTIVNAALKGATASKPNMRVDPTPKPPWEDDVRDFHSYGTPLYASMWGTKVRDNPSISEESLRNEMMIREWEKQEHERRTRGDYRDRPFAYPSLPRISPSDFLPPAGINAGRESLIKRLNEGTENPKPVDNKEES